MKLAVTLALLCSSVLGWAQFDGLLTTPTTQDRFVVMFTNDTWLDLPEGVELRPYSPGLSAYILTDYDLSKSAFSFAWGYGFSSHNVHSNGEFVTDTVGIEAFSNFETFDPGYSFQKNKLSCNYLEIPIELRIRTGKRKERDTWEFQADPESVGPQFNMAIGARIGYAINVHTKTIDEHGKRKFYGVEQFQPLRYGLTARVGFGSLAVCGFYSLTPIIQEGKGTELVPVSVGIAWLIL